MPFSKGDPNINLAGRPVGAKNFTTKVREALEALSEGQDKDGKPLSYERLLIESILYNAIVRKDPVSQRLIWNYLDGMPAQSIQHSGQIVSELTEEQKSKLEELLGYDKQRSTRESDNGDSGREDLPVQ